jgi:sulfonate transport system substrate-binding protein
MKMGRRIKKAWLLVSIVLMIALALAGCGKAAPKVDATGLKTQSGSEEKAKIIRIGYQKYGTMNILKAQGGLEKALKDSGVTVSWTEFPGGPQLLEALNVGSIDIGHTGEAPPIFAQAAGAPFVYLAHEPSSPKSEAILVHQDSPIKSVADLKGKKVALNKGSNVHYLLVKALEKAGLQYEEIQTAFLPPADARAAFERKSVDAWVIWDPFFSAAVTATKARVLTNGTDTVLNYEYYLAARHFAESNPDITKTLLDELKKVDQWSKANRHEVATLLSPQLGIDVPSLETAAERRAYGVQEMDDTVAAEQQKIADTFHKLGLIPKNITVKDAMLSAK